MTDYSSVKNTAKNGKLIRAEIREYVLAMGLINGFYQDNEFAQKYYPNNEHRQKQCTLMNIKKARYHNDFYVSNDLKNLVLYLTETMRTYYKNHVLVKNKDNYNVLFYDTKKFRIYYKRLRYGREYKVNLSHTMQYMWTDVLLSLMFVYGYDQKNNCIDLNKFWFYKESVNKKIAAVFLINYLHNVCKIKNITYSCKENNLYFQNTEEIINKVTTNATFIKNKLVEGKYIHIVTLQEKKGENNGEKKRNTFKSRKITTNSRRKKEESC